MLQDVSSINLLSIIFFQGLGVKEIFAWCNLLL